MQEDPGHRRQALEFLTLQFGSDAPAEIALLARYPGGELEGEGNVSVYGFRASHAGASTEDFFTVVGQTQPNYYPTCGLDPDQMYSLHVGTRFMLVLQIEQAPLDSVERELTDLEAQARAILDGLVPGASVSDFRCVAAFRLEGQTHVVCRLRIAGEEVYVIAGNAPPGIYRYTQLPPHVVYRLHLGNLIRNEPEDKDEGDDDGPGL